MLGVAKEGRHRVWCSWPVGRSLDSLLVSWKVLLFCYISPWPCRAHGTIQHRSHVSLSSFRNPSVASKLSTHILKLLVRLRQASSARLKRREELLGLYAANTDKLHAHNELALNSRTMVECVVSGPENTDVLIKPSGEGEHLGHPDQTVLFL
jgi:hypothetical protein